MVGLNNVHIDMTGVSEMSKCHGNGRLLVPVAFVLHDAACLDEDEHTDLLLLWLNIHSIIEVNTMTSRIFTVLQCPDDHNPIVLISTWCMDPPTKPPARVFLCVTWGIW